MLDFPRAVLYLRLSVTDDASTSMARQEADLRELAEREGWEVARVLSDDGISGRKVRANVGTALRMLRDGEAEVLAVWKLDRLTRQGLSAVGDLVDALDASPGALFVAMKDGLRSDQPAWRIIAAVLAEVARTEAENTVLRVRSAIAAGKKAGRFTGGVIPYGYRTAPEPGGPGRILVPHVPEVAIIREVAERLLDGESVNSVALDLTARRVPTTRSPYRRALLAGNPTEGLDTGRWTTNIVQLVMTSENLLGRLKHHGKLVTDADGLPAQFFEPVIDYATLARLRDTIRDPRLPAKRPQRRRAARLLSGVAYCAFCQSRMYVNTSGSKPVYACPRRVDPLCPAPRMTCEHAERVVEEQYFAHLGHLPEVETIEQDGDPDTAEALAAIEAALREASSALMDDEVDTEAAMARIVALKARRASLNAAPIDPVREVRPTGRTLAEAWEASDSVDARRQLLLQNVDHVTITLNTAVGRKGYHPERVKLRFYS